MKENNEEKYKNTIWLPKTSFSMKANLPIKEKELSQWWKEIDVYNLNKKYKSHCEKFSIIDGPPYANGNLHIGHGIPITLKDTICRVKKNFNVNLIHGRDCHGFPIEIAVQKKGIKIDNVENFRDECKKFAEHWCNIQEQTTCRMGAWGDYNKNYYTMNHKDKIYEIFSQMILNDDVFVLNKPTPWSITEGSTITDSEMEYENKNSTSVYIKFKIINSPNHNDCNLIIWTTTPWTLLDNEAVAFSENFEYVIFEYENENYIIIDEQYENFCREFNLKTKLISNIKGKNFKNCFAKHPLLNLEVPLLNSDHVTKDGTGFVHIAPAHGIDDYNLWKQQKKTSFRESVNDYGFYYENTILQNLHIFKNEKEILEKLNPVLFFQKNINHSYPFCSRSLTKTPVIYRSTTQVFINIENFKKNAEKYCENIKWYPNDLGTRAINIFKNREEWCVSRQRVWGTPLAIFVNKNTKKILSNMMVLHKVREQIEKNPAFFFNMDCISILEGLVDNINDYEPIIGILDVWFDSGAVFNFLPEHLDANLICEGKDQIRGWFQSTLLCAYLTDKKPPIKEIVSHGFILDENGKKMSKSVGNVIELDYILNNLGLEIFRILLYTSDYSDDIRVGKNILEKKSDIYRKIRNVFRFMISVCESSDNCDFNYDNYEFLEKVVLHKLNNCMEIYLKERDNYNFKTIFENLFEFIQFLSSIYFVARKDSIYCDSITSNRKRSCISVIYKCLRNLTYILSAFLPFTSEEIYIYCKNHFDFGDRESIHTYDDDYLIKINSYMDANLEYESMDEIIKEINIKIDDAKQNGSISSNGEICLIIPRVAVRVNENYLLDILNVSNIIIRGTEIKIEKSKEKKCSRCWIYRGDLCSRCALVLRTLDGVFEL